MENASQTVRYTLTTFIYKHIVPVKALYPMHHCMVTMEGMNGNKVMKTIIYPGTDMYYQFVGRNAAAFFLKR